MACHIFRGHFNISPAHIATFINKMATRQLASLLGKRAKLFSISGPLQGSGCASFHTTSYNLNLTKVEEKDGVRWITLDNPKRRNALSSEMLDSLEKEITMNKDDINLRCIVLSGNGPAFSAGHDLSEMTKDRSKESIVQLFDKCSRIMMSIQKLPVPVIAQVQGVAAAAGCQLIASCDIVIASENAQFSTPGVRVGLFCSTPGIPVSRSVPQKSAALMLFTGEPISAQDALRCGLISRVVPADELQKETEKIIQSICEKSRSALALGKEFFYKQLNMNLENAYREGCKVMVENLEIADCQEGIQAFLTKRKPQFKHTFDKV